MTEPQYVLQIRVEQGCVYEHPLHSAGITLGRQPDNDVVLDHALVSDHHLRIEKAPSGVSAPFVALDLGARELPHAHSGTLYQGRRLLPGAPVPLSLDDPLTIGPYTLRVTARAAAGIAAAESSPAPAVPRSGGWGKANVNEEIPVAAAIPVHVDPEAVGLASLLEKIEGWLARLRRIVWPF